MKKERRRGEWRRERERETEDGGIEIRGDNTNREQRRERGVEESGEEKIGGGGKRKEERGGDEKINGNRCRKG